jgi:predicted PurR-regulated permease PerM
MMERSSKMWQALAILMLLAIVLAYALYPYISAFFGAFILYAVFKPLYRFLTSRLGLKPAISALAVISISILAILIPVYIFMTIAFLQIQTLFQDVSGTYSTIESTINYIHHISNNLLPVEIGLMDRLMELVASLANSVSIMALGAISTIGQRLVEFIIMYFLLFYLLVGDRSAFAQSLQNAIPFNKENTKRLLEQFTSLVRTILISTGMIAVMQGAILTVTFLLLDIEGAFFWGFVTMLLSFLPVVGPPVIWVPTLVLQIIQGDLFTAAGVLIGGILHTLVDKVLRPFVQKRVGKIHPLITLVGVITGLKLFGLLGVIMGPLLISYVLLVSAMFHEEYISRQENGHYEQVKSKNVEESGAINTKLPE